MSATNCQKFFEQLSLYLANELPDPVREEIRAHLEACAACREELESLRLLNGAMAMSPLPDKLDAKRIAAIVAKHRAVTSAPKKKPIRFPKLSPATLVWLAPLARAAVFILLPGALLLGVLMPASMKARRGQYAMITGQRPSVQGVSALNGDDTYVDGILRESQQAVAAAEPQSKSLTTPTSDRKAKETSLGWFESDRLGRNALAENKSGDNSPGPASVLKSEISNLEAAAPATPAAMPAIALASDAPPPPPASVQPEINGTGSAPQDNNLGETPAVTESFFAYTANPRAAKLADGKKEKTVLQNESALGVASSGLAIQSERGNVFSGGLVSADLNGRVDATRGVVPAAPAKPAAPGWQFQAAQADQSASGNGVIADGTIKDLKKISGGTLALGSSALTKSGSGTLTLDGANAYAGVTVVNGGTLVAAPSGGVGGGGTIVAKASAAKPADAVEEEVAFENSDATVRAVGGRVAQVHRYGGAARTDRDVAANDLYFDRSGVVKEAAKAVVDEQRQSAGSSGTLLRWGLTAGEGAGGGAGVKSRELAESKKSLGLLTDLDKKDFGTVTGKEIAMGDTDGDGRDKDVSKRLEEVDSFAVNRSGSKGEKRAEAGEWLLAKDDRRDPAATGADQSFAERKLQRPLEKTDERAKRQVSGRYFFSLDDTTSAQPAPEETEKLKTEYPKPMFVGTPVPTKLPNLEPPAAGPVVTRAYTVPNETMAKFKGGNGYEGLTKQLEEKGIKTPAGSKATYDAETEQLVVTSTPQGLAKLNDVVASLKNSDEQKTVSSASSEIKMVGMLSPSSRPDLERLTEKSMSDLSASKARWEQVKDLPPDDLINHTEYFANDANLQWLRTQFTDSQAQLKKLAVSRSTNDAEVRKLDASVTELRSKLERALGGVKEAIKADYEVAKARNEALQSDLAARKPAATSEPARPVPPREPAGFNPYIEAKDDAFSTFSIDVDTASYTLTRHAIEEGRLPDPEQVRTEEIVNAFDYDYATPASGAFAMHAEFAPSPFRAPLELLKVGIRGRVLGRDAKKPAVLTLVIDTSGSMDTADRLGRIRPALRMLVDQLKPNDTVAIVAFNNDARLLLDRTRGENKQAILAAIDALVANGSTQLEGGMKLAYEVAARGFISGGANRVVLMSDGVANLGAATAQEILASVDQYRKQGIYLTVLGFGSGNYDDAMLMQLADKGDGAYSFVDSDEEAKRLLVDQWEQTLNVIAKDVKIQIEFNPERVKRWRQIGYEKRHLTKQDFRNDAVDAGEVGSGQSVTALYDVELKEITNEFLSFSGIVIIPPIATMRVRYKDPDTGKVTELEQRITDANRHANFASAPVRFRAAACAAEFAELLRVSPYTAGSDFAAVIEQLRPVAAALTLDQRVQELLRMAERARGLAK